MTSNIRWIGFWQELPWMIALLGGWCFFTILSVGIAFSLPPAPQWVLWCIICLPQLACGGFAYGIVLWSRLRRAQALASVAEQMGMAFLTRLDDLEMLPPRELPLMSLRYGQPRNILVSDLAGIKVWMFDLAAGWSRRVREQTVVYFPEPLPGLSDFPSGLFGWKMPKAYASVVRGVGGLNVEARSCRLIVYRWHHLVRPTSYPELLAIARQIYDGLAVAIRTV